MIFRPIRDLCRKSTRLEGPEAFRSALLPLWGVCKSQVLKYEALQFYDQSGDKAYDALTKGDWTEAVRLIPESRSVDLPVYVDLRQKGVDIVRCRPISSPMSNYLKWELENYHYNKEYGDERIFVCNRIAITPIFEQSASRDFIVFDARAAFIYDYNDKGVLLGGWVVEHLCEIVELMKIFMFIKSQSHPFDKVYPK